MDWRRHYDAIYRTMGVDAELFIETDPVDVVVIDKTSGVVVDGSPGISTIKPGCTVRTHELDELDVDRDDLRHATISFNGGSWRIESFNERPSPVGQSVGELLLVLTEAPDGSA